MCGRIVLFSPLEIIKEEFNLGEPFPEIEPHYNIAPSQEVLIVINDGSKRLSRCTWGFIPSWSHDSKTGYKMINARAETLAEKPSYKTALRKQRCLVVADGFYEWQKKGKEKRPLYIHLKSGKPFGLAGLYNYWETSGHEIICTCTIITTESNELLGSIHDRMPAIMPGKYQDDWLDPGLSDIKRISPLLVPYSSGEMEAYYVSQKINSPRNDSKENIKIVEDYPIED